MKLADFRPTQCNMTALDYGRQIGHHENWTPTLTKNRNSQVLGDSDISSGGEFGMSGEWWVVATIKSGAMVRANP